MTNCFSMLSWETIRLNLLSILIPLFYFYRELIQHFTQNVVEFKSILKINMN